MRKGKDTTATTEATVAAAPETVTASIPATAEVTAQLALGDEKVEAADLPTDLPEADARAPRKVVAHGKIAVQEYIVTDKDGQPKLGKDGQPIKSKWLDGFAVSVVESTKYGQVEHYLQIFATADQFATMLLTAKAADPTLERIMGNIFPVEGYTVADLQTLIGNGCPIMLDVPKVGVDKKMVTGTDGVERPETETATVLWATVLQGNGNLVFSLAGSRNRDTRAMNEALGHARAAISYATTYSKGWVRGLMLNNQLQRRVKASRPQVAGQVAESNAPAIATANDLNSLSVPAQQRQNRSGGYGDSGYRNRGSNRGNGGYRGRGNGNGSYGNGSYGRGDNRSSGRSRW